MFSWMKYASSNRQVKYYLRPKWNQSRWSYLLFVSCHMSTHSASLPLYCHMSSSGCTNCPCGYTVVIQRRLVGSICLSERVVDAGLIWRAECSPLALLTTASICSVGSFRSGSSVSSDGSRREAQSVDKWLLEELVIHHPVFLLVSVLSATLFLRRALHRHENESQQRSVPAS